jgi:hypothetical protein
LPPRPGGGRWRASTHRLWDAWHTSGRASLLDDAGLEGLARLLILHDKAEAKDWAPSAAREVRLQEALLLRGVTATGPALNAETPAERKTRRLAERRDERASLTSAQRDDQARDELAALTA